MNEPKRPRPLTVLPLPALWALIGLDALLQGLGQHLLWPPALGDAGSVTLIVGYVIDFGLMFLYFATCYRITRALEGEAGWAVSYSPISTLWRQLVPLYNLWFLFRWTGDVFQYVGWREKRGAWLGLVVYGLLVAGSLSWTRDAGQVVLFAGVTPMVNALRNALRTPAPDDGTFSPGYRAYFERVTS